MLILLGGYFFIRTVAPQFDLGAFWPVIFIVIGVALVIGSIPAGWHRPLRLRSTPGPSGQRRRTVGCLG